MIDRIHRVMIRGKVYEKDQLRVGFVLLLPTLIALVLLFVIPAIQVITYSFTNFSLTSGQKAFNGLANYRYIFTDTKFVKALGNTFTFALLKLVFDTTIALALALMLDSRIPFKRFLRSVYFAPVVVPVVASSLIWIWFFDPGIGPFNQVLIFFGLPKLQWLYHEDTALISIILFSIWKGMGYNMVLFLAGLQNIPDSYVEAAKVDGASSLQILLRIKLPLLRPIISFVIMIGIINSFKVFAEINVMTPRGGPLYSTALMVVYIYEQAFSNGKMGRACAASLLLFIIILLLTTLQHKMGTKKTIELD